jgi:hypothetical protein
MISRETKERLESCAWVHGLKKNFLIESAVLHYISALELLPADVIISPYLVVSRSTVERLLERIAGPKEPTTAMKELFEDDE